MARTDLTAAEFPLSSFREAAPHLRRPFAPAVVRFKVQSQWPKDNPASGQVVAYVDARLVIERLNLLLPDAWADRYEQLDPKHLLCHLTVDGITRSDVGASPSGDPKALYSDALKRAAAKFGVGVSVYAIPAVVLDIGDGASQLRRARNGKRLYLADATLAKLREGYARWLTDHGQRIFGPVLDHMPEPPASVNPETGEVEDQGAKELAA